MATNQARHIALISAGKPSLDARFSEIEIEKKQEEPKQKKAAARQAVKKSSAQLLQRAGTQRLQAAVLFV
jgi:hypothetical protein